MGKGYTQPQVNIFTAAGSRHGHDSAENQDAALFCHDERYSVICLADGVSACIQAKQGAENACRASAEFMLAHAQRLFKMTGQDISYTLTDRVLYSLRELSAKSGVSCEEYSSTLACVLLDREDDNILYFSVGDSLITAAKNGDLYIVAMPSDSREGCCVTTTVDAASAAKAGVIDAHGISSVMLCSDGAWRIMYRRSRLLPAFGKLLLKGDCAALGKALLSQERADDCTVIIMDKTNLSGRNTQ